MPANVHLPIFRHSRWPVLHASLVLCLSDPTHLSVGPRKFDKNTNLGGDGKVAGDFSVFHRLPTHPPTTMPHSLLASADLQLLTRERSAWGADVSPEDSAELGGVHGGGGGSERSIVLATSKPKSLV